MQERTITRIPLNCSVRGNVLKATFPEGVYDCSVNCAVYKFRVATEYKLQKFPKWIARLSPVNQGTGTVCGTETCDNQGSTSVS